jgi:hypothetical protein
MSVFRFEELLAPLVGLEPPPARTRLTAAELEPFLGAYQTANGANRLWVTRSKNRLRVELSGSGAQGTMLPLWPDAAGRWEFGETSPGTKLSFDRGEKGAATGAHLWQRDAELFHGQRVIPASDWPSIDKLMAFRKEKQGGERIDALKKLEMKGQLKVGANQIDNVVVAVGSDRAIRRLNLPVGLETITVNGDRVKKEIAGQPAEDQTGVFHDQALRISPLARVRDWRETFTSMQVAGKDKIRNDEVWIVRLECKFLPPITRYVSVNSGLLVREDAWITAKGVGTVPYILRFDDYREVAGVKMPFRLSTESAVTGRQVMQFTEAKPNPDIDEGSFK